MDAGSIKEKVRILKTQYLSKEIGMWDDEEAVKGKIAMYVLEHELTPYERTLMMLYSDLGSFKKLGEMFGCSGMSARNMVKEIRDNMRDRIELLYDLV